MPPECVGRRRSLLAGLVLSMALAIVQLGSSPGRADEIDQLLSRPPTDSGSNLLLDSANEGREYDAEECKDEWMECTSSGVCCRPMRCFKKKCVAKNETLDKYPAPDYKGPKAGGEDASEKMEGFQVDEEWEEDDSDDKWYFLNCGLRNERCTVTSDCCKPYRCFGYDRSGHVRRCLRRPVRRCLLAGDGPCGGKRRCCWGLKCIESECLNRKDPKIRRKKNQEQEQDNEQDPQEHNEQQLV